MNNNDKKQQLSEEELQKTQVLNLADFKKVTKLEKMCNKKPASIIALIGIIAIIIGAGYPAVQSLTSKTTKDDNKVQARKVEKDLSSKLNCTKTTNVQDGTTEKIVINYNFNNNKLKSFTKDYTLTVTPGSAIGENAIKTFKEALPKYLTQKSGYQISTKEIENGISVSIKVDYDKLNVNELPQVNQDNYRFNVTYVKDSTKESILKDMQNQEFSCL